MITQSDGTVLYTEEERTAIIDKYDENISALQSEIWNATLTISSLKASEVEKRDRVLAVFRDEVREGTMDSDNATELFNRIAFALGWDKVSSVRTLWGVSVTYYDQVVAEFSDIEADDEDDACEQVRQNMEVESSDVQFVISYNGDTCEESAMIETSSYDFEFQACEQD